MKNGFLLSLVLLLAAWSCGPVVKEYRELKNRNYEKYFPSGQVPVYTGDSLKNLIFPLGGIGQPKILLGGRGEIRQMDFMPGTDAFFALWIKQSDEFNSVKDVKFAPVVRILEGKIPESAYAEQVRGGGGVVPGLPRLDRLAFRGEYPFAKLSLSDPDVPVSARLTAWHPFIPADLDNSSLPVSFFDWEIQNPLDKAVQVSLVLVLRNNLTDGSSAVSFPDHEKYKGIELTSGGKKLLVIGESTSGAITLIKADPEHQLQILWQDFREDGKLDSPADMRPENQAVFKLSAIWTQKEIPAGSSLTFPFVFAWGKVKNDEMIRQVLAGRERLYGQSRKYADILLESSYPDDITEALISQPGSRLFPRLEKQNTEKDIHNRGYASLMDVMKIYRLWKEGGDTVWLKKLWPNIQKAITESSRYPNPQTPSLLLAVLSAAEEMSLALDDSVRSVLYAREFSRKKSDFENISWNGEFFVQETDKKTEACAASQLSGQYQAYLAGMGSLVDTAMIRKALQSVYRYNYHKTLRQHENLYRAYVLNEEGGLLNLSWPYGHRPELSDSRADEVWVQNEYELASCMMINGMIDEGLEILRTSRTRYRGFNRNPWQGIIEGSFPVPDILPALSGISYDAGGQILKIAPAINSHKFSSFFTAGESWGKVELNGDRLILSLAGGEIRLKVLEISGDYNFSGIAEADALMPEFSREGRTSVIFFREPVILQPDDVMTLLFR